MLVVVGSSIVTVMVVDLVIEKDSNGSVVPANSAVV